MAANLGTLGSANDGLYIYNAKPGQPGPRSPSLQGFDAANNAVAFDGVGGGVVQTPALNLSTNTVTMTTWINAKASQTPGAGIVFCRSSATISGLTIDRVNGGLGLGYTWADDINTYNWSPSELGLPPLPDSQWAFAALAVSQDKATIYMGNPSDPNAFTGVSNPNVSSYAIQDFEGVTMFGADPAPGIDPPRYLNGTLDEVAIFNRSLSAGEVFSQFATGVGGIGPKIFADLRLLLTGDWGPAGFDRRRRGHAAAELQVARNSSEFTTTSVGVLTIASATAGDSGTYDVTISNGSGTVTSAQVTVTVNEAQVPEITELRGFQDRTLYPGGTLSLGVVATGGGLKYEWYKDSVLIASATGPNYLVSSVATGDAGSYTVKVANALGFKTGGPVVITIPSRLPAVTKP